MDLCDNIVLASASPRRSALLKQLGLNFVVREARIQEETIGMPPLELVKQNAILKAEAVRPFYDGGTLIIAADTVVLFDGMLFGKPHDAHEAADMLSKLSGNTHEVITGCCLLRGDKQSVFIETAAVWMRALSETEISDYIKTGETFDKAGAYGIQDRGAAFISRVEGDFYAVVGLPLARLCVEMRSILGQDRA